MKKMATFGPILIILTGLSDPHFYSNSKAYRMISISNFIFPMQANGFIPSLLLFSSLE